MGVLRRLHDDRGAAAVEFAIILPLLVMMLLGIIEFARAYNAKEALQYAVREGARHLALNQDLAAAEQVAEDRAIGLSGVTATASGCSGSSTADATVTATYDLTYNIPLFASGTWTLTATGVMRCYG